MSVTLKDVAEKLGVTITTVHKALNGKEGVSEKRRAEIMKVAAQMGYNFLQAVHRGVNLFLRRLIPQSQP